MKTKLPDHYTARQAGMEDLSEIHRLESKKSLHYLNAPGYTVERLRNTYESPGFEMGKSILLIENQEGLLVALTEVWDQDSLPVTPWVWVSLDPDHEGLGLEEYLLEWAELRASEVFARLDPELRVATRFEINSAIKSIQGPLQKAGWDLIRHGFIMRIEMDEMPPEPTWPEGVQLKTYDPEEHARMVYDADVEAFQDHFGFVKEDPEVGFKRFMHHMTGDDSYDPSLWFLAFEGDEIAGICICRRYGAEDPETGYVSILGVRRAWRRRGIAQALLLTAFREYYRRGKMKVDLGVDGESLTGATDLYKKVGMFELHRDDLYEKELRAGKDISVRELEESVE